MLNLTISYYPHYLATSEPPVCSSQVRNVNKKQRAGAETRQPAHLGSARSLQSSPI